MTRLADKYRLGKRIGGGGMAEVVEAEVIGAEGFARQVAIKRILTPLASDARFGEMFVNEARLASLLHHPNIVSVLDFDLDDDGGFYLVMERVRGVDLSRLVSKGRLPHSIAAFVIAEVLRGLAYAHELVDDGRHLHIVHRDVSPHNVMLSWSGGVKVVDFGIAKAVASSQASRSGALKGKLAYMSPEQAHAGEIDGRTDVFAVGVMLHELLTGQRLFSGATEAEVLANVLTRPIPRPGQLVADVPPALDALTMVMVERDLDRRIASASLALEEILSSGVVSARGSLDLSELLRQRFPGDAPARADLSGPARRAPSAVPVPVLPFASPPPLAAPAESEPIPKPVDAMAFETTAASDDGIAEPAGQPISSTLTTRNLRNRVAGPSSRSRLGPQRKRIAVAAAVSVVLGFAGMALVAGPESGARESESALRTVNAEPSLEPSAATDDARAAEVAVLDASPALAEVAFDRPEKDAPAAESENSSAAAVAELPAADSEPPARSPSRVRERSLGSGELKVTAEPWALVTVDGKSYGQTPVTLELSAGRHRVLLVNDDYRRREDVPVKVRAGKRTSVHRKWGTALQ